MKKKLSLALCLLSLGVAAQEKGLEDEASLMKSISDVQSLSARQVEALAQLMANCAIVPKSEFLPERCGAAAKYFTIVVPDDTALYYIYFHYVSAVRDLSTKSYPSKEYEKKLWLVTKTENAWTKAIQKRLAELDAKVN